MARDTVAVETLARLAISRISIGLASQRRVTGHVSTGENTFADFMPAVSVISVTCSAAPIYRKLARVSLAMHSSALSCRLFTTIRSRLSQKNHFHFWKLQSIRLESNLGRLRGLLNSRQCPFSQPNFPPKRRDCRQRIRSPSVSPMICNARAFLHRPYSY